jgi:ribosomal-protein-alanine N-acetyltransferase
MSIPRIETARLSLRPFTPDDLDDLLLAFGDPEVMRYISGGKPRSREDTETGMLRTIEGWKTRGFGFWAVTRREQESLIGYCGLVPLDDTPEIEVAYGFAKSEWGKGFASEAARASLRFGFEELKLKRIVAVVDPENISSKRVLEKLGMTYTKNGHYYGVDLMHYEMSRINFHPNDTLYVLHRA